MIAQPGQHSLTSIPDNMTLDLLMHGSRIPLLGGAAKIAIASQDWLWVRKPALVLRLSNFLPIGALSSVVQLVLLRSLLSAGVAAETAIIISIQASVVLNFIANMLITWNDQIEELSTRQRLFWSVPLLLAFQAFTPTIWLKLIGAPIAARWLSISPFAIVATFELISIMVNYYVADVLFSRFLSGTNRRLARSGREAKPSLFSVYGGRALTLLDACVVSCRPKQWFLKNVVVLAPLALIHPGAWLPAIPHLVATWLILCLAASSVYLVNDTADRKRDAAHPTKRLRPIASGRLPVTVAVPLAVTLALLAVVSAAFVGSFLLAATILAYLSLSQLYTFLCKHIPVLDVVVLGSLYGMRLLAAFVVISVLPDGWPVLVVITWLLATALGIGKRRSEVRGVGTKKLTRRTLDFYATAAAPIMFYAIQLAVVILSLASLHSLGVTALIAIPAVLFVMFRFWAAIEQLKVDMHPQDVLLQQMMSLLRSFPVLCRTIRHPS